jgi:hypothetical protein
MSLYCCSPIGESFLGQKCSDRVCKVTIKPEKFKHKRLLGEKTRSAHLHSFAFKFGQLVWYARTAASSSDPRIADLTTARVGSSTSRVHRSGVWILIVSMLAIFRFEAPSSWILKEVPMWNGPPSCIPISSLPPSV